MFAIRNRWTYFWRRGAHARPLSPEGGRVTAAPRGVTAAPRPSAPRPNAWSFRRLSSHLERRIVTRRPCLVCGTPSPGSRCPQHTPTPHGHHTARHAPSCSASHPRRATLWRRPTRRRRMGSGPPRPQSAWRQRRHQEPCPLAPLLQSLQRRRDRGAAWRRGRLERPDDSLASPRSGLPSLFLMGADFQAEAESRYSDAVGRRDAIAAAWVKSGSPLLSEGSTGQTVEHPLVKMLRDHDVLVDRLSQSARVRHAGPAPSAVIGSSIGASPAARLRPVSQCDYGCLDHVVRGQDRWTGATRSGARPYFPRGRLPAAFPSRVCRVLFRLWWRTVMNEAATNSEIDHFAEFCREHLVQSEDRWEGSPLELEAWQHQMMGEALAFDADGWPTWRWS